MMPAHADDTRPLGRRDYLAAMITGLVAFIVYALTAAPGVLPGDSGEFQLAAPLLGVVHPTGYPLYLLLGKLWTLLVPLGDMAYRMNLLSAVFSALAVACFCVLSRQLGLGTVTSAIAALTLAFGRTFWSQAVRAEVYALNSLFTVVLFLLAMRGGEASGSKTMPAQSGGALVMIAGYWQHLLRLCRPCLFPFVLGLAVFAHHRLAILLIPALIVLAADRNQGWPDGRHPIPGMRHPNRASGVACLVAFLLPALLNLYVPWRAPATPYLRLPVGGGPELVLYRNTLADFLAEISGSVFRGSLELPTAGLSVRLAMAWHLLMQQFGPVGLSLAAIGLVGLRRRPRFAIALVLAYVAVLAFCLVYYIGDIADLFTPSYIVIALWIAGGISLLATMARRIARWPGQACILTLAALLPMTLLTANWPALDMSKETATRTAWQNLLGRSLPQGAILVSNDRDEMTPMWYLQYVEGVRPDLIGLFPKIIADSQFSTLGSLLDWLLARGQKPYLIKQMPGLEVKYSLQAANGLAQVTGYAAAMPVQPDRPLDSSLGGVVRLIGADVSKLPSAGEVMTVTLYWLPDAIMSEDYHSFVQLMTADGERQAGSDHRPGEAFYPTSMWMSGDVIVDRHVIPLPTLLAPGTYDLHAGMYSYPSLKRLPLTGSNETTIALGSVQIR